MVQLSYSELKEAIQNGNDTLANAAEAARGAVCNLYRNYPGWLTGGGTPFPAQAALRGFYNHICPLPTEQPPDAPQKPYTGGQCPIDYKVTFSITTNTGTTTGQFARVRGPLGSLSYTKTTAGSNVISTARFSYDLNNATGPKSDVVASADVTAADPPRFLRVAVTSVTPLDGKADTCGDPTPIYDPSLPPVQVLNYNTNITVNNQTISVPVSIIPVITNVGVTLAPEIKVDLGGFTFNFNIGGVDINLKPNINLPGNSFPNPDPRNPAPTPVPQPSPGGGSGNCPDVDLTPILTKLNELDAEIEVIDANVDLLLNCDRCKLEPANSSNYAKTAYGEAQSRVITLNSKSRWVTLSLTTTPKNAKTQWGVNAPDVYYAGWGYFLTASKSLVRHPIHFVENAFATPEGTLAFAYTLPEGYAGVVTDVYDPRSS